MSITGQETRARKFVARSQSPSLIGDWLRAAVAFGATRERRGSYRFADGSAVVFTPTGLPVEFLG